MQCKFLLSSVFGLSTLFFSGQAMATACYPPTVLEDRAEASRFLAMAGLGGNNADLDALIGTDAEDWLVTQFTNTPMTSSYFSETLEANPYPFPPYKQRYNFWNILLDQDAKQHALRHRAAFALSQIMVVSDNISHGWLHIPQYQDLLFDGAFGTYKDVLNDVTYSPSMAIYLTYLRNQKEDPGGRVPDENYAREILQLFTIGLVELEEVNGQINVVMENGEGKQTYDNDDIEALAKIFTGLSYESGFGGKPITNAGFENYKYPLKMHNQWHSNSDKSFLNIPSAINISGDGDAEITQALDHIEAHDNVPYFVSRLLIQRFTASHPTDQYIIDVANAYKTGLFTSTSGTVFGNGARGNLEAVLAAILLHPTVHSMTSCPISSQQEGKVREPVLKVIHWAQAFNIDNVDITHLTGDQMFKDTSRVSSLAQQPYGSPSVFNFYRPGYIAPNTKTGNLDMTMPELQIVNGGSRAGFLNFMTGLVFGDVGGFNPDYLNLENTLAGQDGVTNLVDELDELLTGSTMQSYEKLKIRNILNGSTLDNSENVKLAVLMVVASTAFGSFE